MRRPLEAHDLVDDGGEAGLHIGRPDRYREHDPLGTRGPDDLACGARRRTGRDPVVDHDDGSPGQRKPGPVAVVDRDATFELDLLGLLHRDERVEPEAEGPQHIVVDDHNVLADRTHGELGLRRNAQLSDHDHFKGGVQLVSHLGPHGDTAPGERDDDGVLGGEVPEGGAEPSSGVCAVAVGHGWPGDSI